LTATEDQKEAELVWTAISILIECFLSREHWKSRPAVKKAQFRKWGNEKWGNEGAYEPQHSGVGTQVPGTL
jgi:hypothetical protein